MIEEAHLILRQKLKKITVHLQLLSKSDIIGKKKVVVNWWEVSALFDDSRDLKDKGNQQSFVFSGCEVH